MKHEMKLRAVYFDKIKNGEKIYEIRLNDEKRQQIKIGDVLLFTKDTNLEEQLMVEVQDLIYFKNFDEMLNILPVKKIGFENMDKTAVKTIYHQFYSVTDEKEYGVVAIKVKVLH